MNAKYAAYAYSKSMWSANATACAYSKTIHPSTALDGALEK